MPVKNTRQLHMISAAVYFSNCILNDMVFLFFNCCKNTVIFLIAKQNQYY